MYRKYVLVVAAAFCGLLTASAAETPPVAHFRAQIQPILSQYCFDCHADGANKGGVAFDQFTSDNSILTNHTLWLAVLKNVRSGMMPPQKKSQPSTEERKALETWIKYDAFGIDPKNPDPGRITVRRLNRIEYRNTIHDLIGVDYDTDMEFPPDDTGYGFDDIADVLTISPMLLEKYLDAAKSIISRTIPMTSRVMPEKTIVGKAFHKGDAATDKASGPQSLSYYEKSSISNLCRVDYPGKYQLALDFSANEKFIDDQFDYNKCKFIFSADGHELFQKEFTREGNRHFHQEFTNDWTAGDHLLTIEIQPLTPDQQQVRSLTLRIENVKVRGPMDQKYWVAPADYARYFPKEVPNGSSGRRVYAKELLGHFATKAFRRPVDEPTLTRLVTLAESIYRQPDQTFEAGVAQAMVAVLASPRFLFREEAVEPHHAPGAQPLVDEYALASRLSYFLWSSMPDDELFRLARENNLRENLDAQVKRMLADSRANALTKNFVGQWLQARDIETVAIDSRTVLNRDEKPDPVKEKAKERFNVLRDTPEENLSAGEKEELKNLRAEFRKAQRAPLRADLNDEIRRDMRRETEMYFGNIIHQDRSINELIESDYTYLNERLAKHYGLTNLNVTGSEFRRVTLPPESQRGGVLTMGTVLAVTSNPTRTSPVKRGLFVLENILGNPTPPPPANIPPLEAAEKANAGHELTLREMLEIHREKPLCSSCHSRMDPLGLAFENFNAMGMWRENERGQSLDCAGKLITGESFKDLGELKHILATKHRTEFYRTLTEKMLTYALGRGLEYYDVETVDQIVGKLEQNDGHFSALLSGIIESSPFQERRSSDMLAQAETSGRSKP